MKKITPRILRNYETPSGKTPFLDWLASISDLRTRMRIRRRLDRVQLGNLGDYKSLGDEIYELKLAFGPGYRIYYSEHEGVIIILLCGGDKSSQTKDIETAKSYLKELKGRCDE